MSRKQVQALLGAPRNKDINPDGSEVWDFFYASYYMSLTVQAVFLEDRLVRYRFAQNKGVSYFSREREPYTPPSIEGGTTSPADHALQREKQAFHAFIQRVDNATFENTRLEIIQEVAAHTFFTVEQVIAIMKIFPFSEARFKALHVLAPRLKNGYDIERLLDFFGYGSDRDKAKKILRENPTVSSSETR